MGADETPDDAERQRLARKAARHARRREEIVAAADELARATGIDGVTADQVATALGISTPSLFYYFPGGLPELRASVAVGRFHAYFDLMGREVAAAPTGTDALVAMIRGAAHAYEADPDGLGHAFEVMQRGAWGAEMSTRHIQKLNALFSVVEEKLARDRAEGRLHAEVQNLRRVAMLMNQLSLGLLVGDQLRRKVGGRSLHGFADLVEDLCGIVRRGTSAG